MATYRQTFISHAHVDNDLCDRYAAALRAKGIDLWYDRDNAQAGHFLGDAIQQELEQRSAFVLLMTEAALDSFWVKLELQAYLGLMGQDHTHGRMLLPVRIGPCAAPPFLNAMLWVDALTMSFDQAIDTIAQALTVAGDVQPAASPTPHLAPVLPAAASVIPISSPLGPAPAPAGATAVPHLTPMPLYNLGFRGYNIRGVECILPPLSTVPGGVFYMGTDKAKDTQAFEDDELQYPIEVGAFSIAQHPVTVAEYSWAVRAKAVREPRASVGEVTWQKQLTRGDHPVVCIYWQEAVAYARWLAKTTGQPWRLPSEAEWEKAARWDAEGQVSRIYPWGDSFDQTRCNTSEGGKKTTTPVGSYPNGASPCGAQDMAGNVQEWTSSFFKPYPYIQNDGREATNSTENRALRGGSWGLDARYARAAYRDVRPLILYDLGFRLVLSASAGS